MNSKMIFYQLIYSILLVVITLFLSYQYNKVRDTEYMTPQQWAKKYTNFTNE